MSEWIASKLIWYSSGQAKAQHFSSSPIPDQSVIMIRNVYSSIIHTWLCLELLSFVWYTVHLTLQVCFLYAPHMKYAAVTETTALQNHRHPPLQPHDPSVQYHTCNCCMWFLLVGIFKRKTQTNPHMEELKNKVQLPALHTADNYSTWTTSCLDVADVWWRTFSVVSCNASEFQHIWPLYCRMITPDQAGNIEIDAVLTQNEKGHAAARPNNTLPLWIKVLLFPYQGNNTEHKRTLRNLLQLLIVNMCYSKYYATLCMWFQSSHPIFL